MKAIVIGGAGFIGSHMVDQLVQEQIEVIVVDNQPLGKLDCDYDTVSFHQMDMHDHRLEHLFAIERPDYVFHFAAQVSVGKSMQAPTNDAYANIIGTINLLQYAVKYNVKRFIFASSAAVYGEPLYLPVDELHPVEPTSFYGLSKALAEEYIRFFAKLHHLEYDIFRFANVFGPRQRSDGEAGVVSIFLNQIIQGLPITIYGNGSQTRDFIYVKDVVKACMKAVGKKGSATMNLGMNRQLSVNDLIKILNEVTGVSIITKYQPLKKGDIMHSRLDNRLVSKELNWQPVYTITEGLIETFLELRQKHIASVDSVR